MGFPRGCLAEAVQSDRRITAAVHRHGTRIVAQLNHFGVQALSDAANDPRVVVGPSAVKSPAYSDVAKAMDLDEIQRNVGLWARSAAMAREAGYDGVEVSVVHGYFLHQFLSPLYNRREDAYGGNLDGRMRLPREVVAAVREAVGTDYVVGVSARGLPGPRPGGRGGPEVGRRLKADGHIDYLNVSAGGYHNLYMSSGTTDVPDGWLVEHVARLKAAVGDLPVSRWAA
jgi:2,4-dienoyl-CoA reductase-like NADH-dependent reductase (Old Yellow Enzyme family)